jgi:diguanylate cyclase (GGDEF)-like protein/PAS domain S-box-containing protein
MRSTQAHISGALTDGYVALDREWRYTAVHGVAARLLGAADALIGRRLHDTSPQALDFLRACEAVMASQEPLTCEADLADPGVRLHVRVSPTPQGIEAFFQDTAIEDTAAWQVRQAAVRLLALTEQLNGARQVGEVVGAVLAHLRRDVYGVLLALHDPDQDTLNVRYSVQYDEAIIQPYLQVPVSAQLPVPDAFRSGETLVLPRAECQRRYPGMRLAQATRHLVALPLRTGGRTLGVLLLSLRDPGPPGVIALSQLSTLAAHCAGAIERAQLHDAAQRSEGRYRTLLESTSAVLWDTEKDFQALREMPTWEAFTGQTYAEYRGRGYLNAVHPDDRARVQAEIAAGGAGAQPFALEGRLLTAAGAYRQVRAQAVPVPDERGEVQAWVGAVHDVTEARGQQRRDDATRTMLLHLSRAGSAREVYRVTLEEVTRLTGTPHALLAGHVREDRTFRLLTAQGVPEAALGRLQEFTLEEGTVLGRKVTRGAPFWLREALEEGHQLQLLTGTFPAAWREVLLVPLRHQQELTALLALGFPAGAGPDDDALEHLTWLQPHLAQALQRAQLLRALERSEAQAQTILSALDEGVLLVDAGGRIVSANHAARRMLDRGEQEPLPETYDPCWAPLAPDGAPLPPDATPAARALKTGQPVKEEILSLRRRDGSLLWISVNATPLHEDQRLRGVVVSFSDVTEAYRLRQQLQAQAQQDDLTGLPNRRVFNQALERVAGPGAREGEEAAVLLLDVDQFKLVNDTHGHHMGDALLRVIARRLTGYLGAGQQGEGSVVTRLAGDEYGLVLPGVGAGAAARTARELVALLAQPVSIQGIEVQVSVCVGLCVGPRDGRSASDLYKHADLALHDAKRGGPGRWSAYTPGLSATHLRRVLVERQLRRAVRADALEVHYQPIVTLPGQAWVSFEALARWQDPELGRVGPDEFIRVAEEAGLIAELGGQIMRRALRQCAAWTAQRGQAVSVSVNVSAVQLTQPDFLAQVPLLLREAGVAPAQLILEVTESVVIQDVDAVVARLRPLRDLGVRVALDDFGTGFSSLSVLERLPIDLLKVDRTFVREVDQNPRRQALLSAVLLIGQHLGITVVAEGVEGPQELGTLERLGCTHAQGYHFARPQPPEVMSQAWRARLDELPEDSGSPVPSPTS